MGSWNAFCETWIFRCRARIRFRAWVRQQLFKRMGMSIGQGSCVDSVHANWPQQVKIGKNANILDHVVFDYCHGHWKPGPAIVIGDRCYVGRGADFNCRVGIKVGNDCLIAAGCRLIDHDHGMALGAPMHAQDGPEAPIELEDDVWLGANVIVLKGVKIGRGAVVAAGAVVRQSIPPYEVWGGVPARRISTRTGRSA